MSDQADKIVVIDYTNWRGERRHRGIIPTGPIYWSTGNQWHKEPQWLLTAIDVEDDGVKDFALRDIHQWDVGRRNAH